MPEAISGTVAGITDTDTIDITDSDDSEWSEDGGSGARTTLPSENGGPGSEAARTTLPSAMPVNVVQIQEFPINLLLTFFFRI